MSWGEKCPFHGRRLLRTLPSMFNVACHRVLRGFCGVPGQGGVAGVAEGGVEADGAASEAVDVRGGGRQVGWRHGGPLCCASGRGAFFWGGVGVSAGPASGYRFIALKKPTPNRPQIDPKSTPNRPQNDPKTTPKRPPNDPVLTWNDRGMRGLPIADCRSRGSVADEAVFNCQRTLSSALKEEGRPGRSL